MDPEQENRWQNEWDAVREGILRYCKRALDNPEDAGDLVQEVALLTYRSFARFRGDASFATWANTIARHEVIRANKSGSVIRRIVTRSIDDSPIDPPDPNTLYGATPVPHEIGMARGVNDAVEATVISRLDANIIYYKGQELTWDEIEQALDIRHAAMKYNRAISRLKTFLFVRRPNLLGGLEAIERAYQEASQSSNPPLNDNEKRLFTQIVLGRQEGHRALFRSEDLRSACVKVANYISFP